MAAAVDEQELVARYVLTQKYLDRDGNALPNAWMPYLNKDIVPPRLETSVFRTDGQTQVEIQQQGEQVADERERNYKQRMLSNGKAYPEGKVTFRLYGWGTIVTKNLRIIQLDAISDEPPPRHGEIINWPSVGGKAAEADCMACAQQICRDSLFLGVSGNSGV
jgi:hypothetical protein